MKKYLSLSFVLLLLFLIGPVQSISAAPDIKLNTMKLSIAIGETYNLRLIGTSQKVTWTTSNKKVVTVSNSGVITGIIPGGVTIKAKINNKEYSCRVSVLSPRLAKRSFSLRYGQSENIQIDYLPKQYSNDISWTSSDENVITIDNDIFKAVGQGSATIKASFGKYNLQASVTVPAFNKSEKEQFAKDNFKLEYAEFNNSKLYLVSSDKFSCTIHYTVEFYNATSLVSVSNIQPLQVNKNKISIMTIPDTDKEYTSYKIRYDEIYIINNPDIAQDINVKATEPYDYSHTYNDNGNKTYDTIKTIDLKVDNNSSNRVRFWGCIVFYKESKIINIKYYSDELDIGTTIIKEHYIQNEYPFKIYNPDFDYYKIYY